MAITTWDVTIKVTNVPERRANVTGIWLEDDVEMGTYSFATQRGAAQTKVQFCQGIGETLLKLRDDEVAKDQTIADFLEDCEAVVEAGLYTLENE